MGLNDWDGMGWDGMGWEVLLAAEVIDLTKLPGR